MGDRGPTSDASRGGCRGVRGATAVDRLERLDEVVGELLQAMLAGSGADIEDVAAVIFTAPDDLVGVNPAAAARRCGYQAVPLMVVREHDADDRVPRCLRALMLVNSPLRQDQVRHAYLGAAAELRPDLVPTSGATS